MCSRKQKRIFQTLLLLTVVFGFLYGAMLYYELQTQLRKAEAVALKYQQHQESLSAQLQGTGNGTRGAGANFVPRLRPGCKSGSDERLALRVPPLTSGDIRGEPRGVTAPRSVRGGDIPILRAPKALALKRVRRRPGSRAVGGGAEPGAPALVRGPAAALAPRLGVCFAFDVVSSLRNGELGSDFSNRAAFSREIKL